MLAKLLLGDLARVSEGKLDVLGAGWKFTGPGPTNLGIGVVIQVPGSELNTLHKFDIRLLDATNGLALGNDGRPIMQISGEANVQSAPGIFLSAPVTLPLAFNAAGLELQPGTEYVVQLTVDGQTEPAWCESFVTRPALAV